jgi:hypothetical protein
LAALHPQYCSPYYFGGWSWLYGVVSYTGGDNTTTNAEAFHFNETDRVALQAFLQWAEYTQFDFTWLGNFTSLIEDVVDWAMNMEGNLNTTSNLTMTNGSSLGDFGEAFDTYLEQAERGMGFDLSSSTLLELFALVAGYGGSVEDLVSSLEALNSQTNWHEGYYRHGRCCPADAGETCDDWEQVDPMYCFGVGRLRACLAELTLGWWVANVCLPSPFPPPQFNLPIPDMCDGNMFELWANVSAVNWTEPPSSWPTPAPTAPTRVPSRAPTRPTQAPSRRPTSVGVDLGRHGPCAPGRSLTDPHSCWVFCRAPRCSRRGTRQVGPA